jgi:hypothetical protein
MRFVRHFRKMFQNFYRDAAHTGFYILADTFTGHFVCNIFRSELMHMLAPDFPVRAELRFVVSFHFPSSSSWLYVSANSGHRPSTFLGRQSRVQNAQHLHLLSFRRAITVYGHRCSSCGTVSPFGNPHTIALLQSQVHSSFTPRFPSSLR